MAWKNVQYENGKMRTSSGGGGGGASALTDLEDVAISSPTIGQGLVYNDQTGKWENADLPSGEITELADLDDVDLSNLADGQILKWDATNQKFINMPFKNTNDIFTPEEKNDDSRLCCYEIYYNNSSSAVTTKFCEFTGTFQDVVGLIIGRNIMIAVNFGNRSNLSTLDYNYKNTVVTRNGATNFSFSYSNPNLMITVPAWERAKFIGVANGVKMGNS